MSETSYKDMTIEELEMLASEAQAELKRRRSEEALEDELAQVLANARIDGVAEQPNQGERWVQPTHAGNAYMRGDVVEHDGQTWVSTVTPNTWEPGLSGWHHQPEDDPETGEPGVPEWVRPSGTHDAYEQGDRVLYNGEIYESIHPTANTWSPDEYPQGWQLIEGEAQ